jgi:hypothetical protein
LSSILRALKKLESEIPHPADVLALPRKIDTKKTISRQAKRLRRSHALFIAFVGVVVLTVAGWLIIGQHASQTREPASADSRNTAAVSVVTTPAAPIPKMKKTLSKPATKIKEVPKKPQKRVNKALIKPTSTPTAGSADKTKRSYQAAAIRTASGKGNLRTKPFIPTKESQLILQAISWDKNSENRIAVINNRIVREGESVDGFLVTRIGKDDVLVREGGNEWKLMFRLK